MIITSVTIIHYNPISIFKILHQCYSRRFLVRQSTYEFNCFVLSWISASLETLQIETMSIHHIYGINENSCKDVNQLLEIMCKVNTNLLSNSSSTSLSKK